MTEEIEKAIEELEKAVVSYYRAVIYQRVADLANVNDDYEVTMKELEIERARAKKELNVEITKEIEKRARELARDQLAQDRALREMERQSQ